MVHPVLTGRRLGQVLIVSAAIGWSTAGILQRQLSVNVITQLAGRSLAALVFLSLVLVVSERGKALSEVRSIDRWGLLFAVCMSGAMAAFIFALNRTTVANVLFVQALSPFVAVGLAYVLLREVPTTRTWIATVVAVGGVALMVGGPGRGTVSGVIASVLMSVLFAITIVIARHQRSISMLPALVMGQVMLFSLVVWFADFASVTWGDIAVFVVMGAFQMGFSQLCFTTGARHLPASEVGLWTLLEVVLGPLWVWLFASETPAQSTLIGGAIVVAAVIYQATERNTMPVIVAAEAVSQ